MAQFGHCAHVPTRNELLDMKLNQICPKMSMPFTIKIQTLLYISDSRGIPYHFTSPKASPPQNTSDSESTVDST